jgi:DNA polymerase I-like protein with 3'-5' exonuclease and polymerase domains
MTTRKIDSLKQLHKFLSVIQEKINSDPQLALAAAANPIYALEEMGYQIDPQIRPELTDYVRFKPDTLHRLAELRKVIFQHAGRSFDLDSAAELHSALFEGARSVAGKGSASHSEKQHSEKHLRSQLVEMTPLPPARGREPKPIDPLESLSGTHPVLDALLEYRRLEASVPRLASRELYQQLRKGQRSVKVSQVRVTLKMAND